MTECYDTGTLRLYMERPSALPDAERAAIAAHLASCAECRQELDNLRVLEASVMSRLSVLAPNQPPDMQAALMKMRAKLRTPDAPSAITGKLRGADAPADIAAPASWDKSGKKARTWIPMPVRPGSRRAHFSVLAAALIVISFISFPTLQAAADNLLQTFRVQSVVFVPVNADRIRELSSLLSDPTSLFISQPTVVGTPKSSRFATVQEAAQAAGFTPDQPTIFPSAPASTRFTVQDNMKVTTQVNVQTIRKLLQTAGITDVSLPDALGSEPITADVPPFVESRYTGNGYSMMLVQGHSPNVTLPKGVDLAQLGKAGLELLGMQPEQADQMSRQIDWSSTLVVPFPAGLSDVLKVDIGGSQGMLVTAQNLSSSKDATGMGNMMAVYWQKGDRFYVLAAHGPNMTTDKLLLAARSVQ
jgi:hypothetical protein